MFKKFFIISLMCLAFFLQAAFLYADENPQQTIAKKVLQTKNKKLPEKTCTETKTASAPDAVLQQTKEEQKIEMDPALIEFYQPTYVLPLYYHYDMHEFYGLQQLYNGLTPNGESLQNIEMKYQFSFKVPVWKNMFNTSTSLYGAYTQLSFWQSYADYAFFRETNYAPEIFLTHQLHQKRVLGWNIDFINFGAIHQSNGQGDNLERSWNRVYLKAIFSRGGWSIDWMHWAVLADNSLRRYNPNIGKYLGDAQINIQYQYQRQNVTLEIRNIQTFSWSKMYPGFQVSWSFPLTKHLNGYVQWFTGFGESLIEYNTRASALGLGISLTNWG